MRADGVIRVEGTERVFHRSKVLAVLLIPLSMSLVAVSSINIALPTIAVGLGATSSDLQWVLAGYALTFGVVLIPAGRAGDVLGRGSVFVAGVAVFTLASLACGLAVTPVQLNVFRFVQGIGAGLFNPQTMGMIQQYFSGMARAKAFALFGMVISVSVAVGPVLAGAVIQAIGPENGWRATFFLNAPLGVLGLVLAFAWFPFGQERASRRRRQEARLARSVPGAPAPERRRADLDPVGALLAGSGVLAFMWPFLTREGGVTWLLAPAGLGIVALWLWWERRYKAAGRQPMVDLDLFSYQSFTRGTGVAGVLFLGATSIFAVLAIHLQSGLGVGALATGAVGLPNAAMSALASWWGGRHALTRGRRLVVLGLSAMVTGVLLSALVVILISSREWSFWWLALPVSAIGWGMGVTTSCNQTLAMEDIPARSGGTAGGVKQTAERIGTAVGTAMVTAVFFSVAASTTSENGFVWAYLVVAGFLTLSLLLALADQRRAKMEGPRARPRVP
ncbi:MAG: MFS transporter [Actinomycetota bacterium]